jgi:hypothetical protein
MVVEQKALVEEALLARTRLRARRAYVQALRGGANRAVALEAAVDKLLEADRTISEAVRLSDTDNRFHTTKTLCSHS